MKIKIHLLVLAICAVAFSLPSAETVSAKITTVQPQEAAIRRCTVNDPTGTPLNVRSSPGGKRIVAKLKNGTRVFVQYYSGDVKDQSWAEVRLKNGAKAKPLGWVLEDFLVCEE